MTYLEKIDFILSKPCAVWEKKLMKDAYSLINDDIKFEKYKAPIDMLYEQKRDLVGI